MFFKILSCSSRLHLKNKIKSKYSKIILLEWFLKDHVTEDWSNAAENTALHHKNKLYFKIYLNRKVLF